MRSKEAKADNAVFSPIVTERQNIEFNPFSDTFKALDQMHKNYAVLIEMLKDLKNDF